ncbi:ribosomal large subunit pseudouridine synthase D [Dyella jiangningensis]|uniref:pseudouridine synthase n=1 Tax=Dyella sp. AtDHG13 TaxID=1938897 RepID=UPI0008878843|nr:pseudouridine synthase [Dyella sp. AtDHG13]PXV58618.1 ribosomal large subunit pseudouridine synthase D [Dyella sp. AtDHG13]SDL13024.1 ribosomal large subunit pseudouridine synthase D [Dyella jiangningensis]
MSRPPAASTVHLPQGPWGSVLDALCALFPRVDRATWADRFARDRVLDEAGQPLRADASCRAGMCVHYFREVPQEPSIPFHETLLHVDAHLVVVDKPHFLPVTPAGGFVEETVLARLTRALGNTDLVPLHRIDRHTAGLVMFSANPASRAAYQALFRDRRIDKDYEAWAAPLPALSFPLVRRSRIVAGEPFFRMHEVPGEPSSETRIAVLERRDTHWRYALQPVTGKKHQLRVHMAALGAPLLYDPFYPDLPEPRPDDHAHPLQLLARRLAFVDPLSGKPREFVSERTLLSMR